MKRAFLPRLACPSCRTGYDLTEHEASGDEVLSGFLTCHCCAIVVPIVQGFPLFTEPRLHAGQTDPGTLAALEADLFGTESDYLEYRQRKLDRKTLEIYAAFQPFNEATRALEPVLEVFADALRPGDLILDPWCRSGWTAAWLAELFPEQTIVTCWEGDKSVLGYRGFGHWFAASRRPQNVEIAFVDPARGLPFADHTFAAVYALDAFHRFSLIPFAGDILRVARPSAVLALAHLHLTNSEPEPYFDRGGSMWHGLDYRAWLDQLVARQGRKSRVFSEADLFQAAEGCLPDENPRTAHYNGFILIEPADAVPAVRNSQPVHDDCRWLVNPLFRIVLSRRVARIEASLHDGMVGALLDRHPIYAKRLPAGPLPLGERQFALLALALTGSSALQSAAVLGLSPETIADVAGPLEAAELLLPVRTSPAGLAMQRFHANQLPVMGPGAAFEQVLRRLENASSNPIMRTSDGGAMTGSDAGLALRSYYAYLKDAGLEPGDSLVIGETRHPLSFLITLAGLAMGLKVSFDQAGAMTTDVTLDEPLGRRRMTVGQNGGASEVILSWIADHPSLPPLTVVPGADLTLLIDGQATPMPAEDLAEAALSLGQYIEDHPDPIDGFGDLFGVLTGLCLLAGSWCIPFRA